MPGPPHDSRAMSTVNRSSGVADSHLPNIHVKMSMPLNGQSHHEVALFGHTKGISGRCLWDLESVLSSFIVKSLQRCHPFGLVLVSFDLEIVLIESKRSD